MAPPAGSDPALLSCLVGAQRTDLRLPFLGHTEVRFCRSTKEILTQILFEGLLAPPTNIQLGEHVHRAQGNISKA